LNLNGAFPLNTPPPIPTPTPAPGVLGAGVPLALPPIGVGFKLSSLPTGGAIDRVVAAVDEDSLAKVVVPSVGAGVEAADTLPVAAAAAAAVAPPRPPRRPPGGAFGLTWSFGGMACIRWKCDERQAGSDRILPSNHQQVTVRC